MFVEPVLLDTRIHINWAQWNHNGSVIAIAGSAHDSAGKESSNVVHFYSPFGEVSYRQVYLKKKNKFLMIPIFKLNYIIYYY